jgi:hypothetical protein
MLRTISILRVVILNEVKDLSQPVIDHARKFVYSKVRLWGPSVAAAASG